MSDSAAASPPPTASNFMAHVQGNLARAASTPAATPPATPAAPAQPPPLAAVPAPTQAPVPGETPEPVQLEQQPAANDNADPWAEQIHGVTARDLIEAARRGELPESVLTAVKVAVKVNGKEMQVPLREAANGYMRISDHTQKTMELADREKKHDEQIGKVRTMFEGWDKPESGAFAKFLTDKGMLPQVNALVTQKWGAPDKPDVNGFMESLRRLGHFETFRQAANAYAAWHTQRVQAFNPSGDPKLNERAYQMVSEYEREQDAMWKSRLESEATTEQLKREQWKRDQQQLLAARQQQPQQHQQMAQQIDKMRGELFARLGIPMKTPVQQETALKYFHQNMGALVNMEKRYRTGKTLETMVQEAAQATHEQLGDAAQQPAQSQQAAQPAALPARPAGAPATNGTAGTGRRSPAEFEEWLRGGKR